MDINLTGTEKNDMPYIRQELRLDIDRLMEELANLIILRAASGRPGQINYAITKLLVTIYSRARYDDYNEAVGVLECVKQELYRRRISAYEDKKISENGDV